MQPALTMSEVLRDPVIRQVLGADGISLGSFAQLLEKAANRTNAQAVKDIPACCPHSKIR